MKYKYFKSIDKEYSDLFMVRNYDRYQEIFIWFTDRYFPSSFLSLESLHKHRDVVEVSELEQDKIIMMVGLTK